MIKFLILCLRYWVTRMKKSSVTSWQLLYKGASKIWELFSLYSFAFLELCIHYLHDKYNPTPTIMSRYPREEYGTYRSDRLSPLWYWVTTGSDPLGCVDNSATRTKKTEYRLLRASQWRKRWADYYSRVQKSATTALSWWTDQSW